MSVYNQGGPSATSLNFIGFEDAAKNNTSPLIYDQVYIQYIHPVAGFLPGQQSFLKPNVEVFSSYHPRRSVCA